MTHHDLKTWPVPFQAVWTGQKLFEIRLDDRYYQRGDTVTLHEYDVDTPCTCPQADRKRHREPDECEKYSGRSIAATIGFCSSSTPGRGNTRGFVGNGYIVFSLVDLELTDARKATAAPPSAATLMKAIALRSELGRA